jgi:hypothetical protein
MSKHFYHGSTKFFSSLQPASWVTDHPSDARMLALPWGREVISKGLSDRRPSQDIILQGSPLKDCPIFVYRISVEKNGVIPIEIEMGKVLDWNWQTTDWANVELVEYYPSWHRLLGISVNEDQKYLDYSFENIL